MEQLHEEFDALKAILMNDVNIEVTNEGVTTNVRIDLKLDGCKVTVEFQGKLKLLYNNLSCCLNTG